MEDSMMKATKPETAKLRASNQALLMRMNQLSLEKTRKESRLSLSAELAEMKTILMISGYQQLFGRSAGSLQEVMEMSKKLEQCELEKCASSEDLLAKLSDLSERYCASRPQETLTPLGSEEEETGERRKRRHDTLIPSDSPLNYQQVVETSIEEFNDILDESTMNEEEKNKFRDLRRKGKNRQAASKSRARKLSTLARIDLEKESEALKRELQYCIKLRELAQDILGTELNTHVSEEMPAFKKKKAGGTGCCGLATVFKRLAITFRRSKAGKMKLE